MRLLTSVLRTSKSRNNGSSWRSKNVRWLCLGNELPFWKVAIIKG